MLPGMGRIRLGDHQPFDLALTLACGQAFRWSERGGWWEAVVGGRLWRLRQEGDRILFEGPGRSDVENYLALDEDLPAILSSIDRDPGIHRSIAACRGLRILRQDPWEILISFICATNANIPRIRGMIARLAMASGVEIPGTDPSGFAFPGPEALATACAGAGGLSRCRLGYRDRYVAGAADIVARDPGVLARLAGLPFHDARRSLLTFPGVGPKAADCILLFGFHRLEAFPVDVWIRRILYARYLDPLPGAKVPSEKEDRRIREFGREHFGPYAGYAQEYLFCNREPLGRRRVRSPRSSSSGTPPAHR